MIYICDGCGVTLHETAPILKDRVRWSHMRDRTHTEMARSFLSDLSFLPIECAPVRRKSEADDLAEWWLKFCGATK